MELEIPGYKIDILVQGYPGKTVCHGALGWSTVALVRSSEQAIIVDTGSFGIRQVLIAQLKQRGLTPADVSCVLLSHAHYDHAVNWTMFPNAKIVIGAAELDWSLRQPWGTTFVPELYVRELKSWPALHTAGDGEEVLPAITAHLAPGHTPGHLIYVLKTRDIDVVFSGDAAKNRAEIISGQGFHTYDAAVSSASIEMIRKLWGRRKGSILVPGHDLPMVRDGGEIRYLGERDASVEAWLGETLDQTTSFSLSLPSEAALR